MHYRAIWSQTVMKSARLKAIRTRLLERQGELHNLAEISDGQRDAVELDQSSLGRVSRIDAIQNQEMALASGRARHAELARIKAALARIEQGDYGHCVVCDEPIAPKRLESDPSLPTCVNCAR